MFQQKDAGMQAIFLKLSGLAFAASIMIPLYGD